MEAKRPEKVCQGSCCRRSMGGAHAVITTWQSLSLSPLPRGVILRANKDAGSSSLLGSEPFHSIGMLVMCRTQLRAHQAQAPRKRSCCHPNAEDLSTLMPVPLLTSGSRAGSLSDADSFAVSQYIPCSVLAVSVPRWWIKK